VDVVESPINGMFDGTAERTLDISGDKDGLSLGEELVAAGVSDGAELGVVTTPLGPNVMPVSVVPTLELLVGCAASGEIVDPVSITMTVLVIDTVRTVPNDPPVPVAPLLGKIPLAGSANGSGFCRLEDEEEASCGIVSKEDLAMVVRGSLLLTI
jgi:hypothetical protein